MMAELDPFLEPVETVADGITGLVNVTDEGLKGAATELGRIAEGVDSLRGAMPVVPTDIGALIGAAFRESLAPVQGAPGRDGVDGGIGPTGPAGKDGRPGRDGVDGVDGVGVPGPTGKTGVTGKAGTDGRDGAPGPGPARVVVERGFDQRIDFAQVYLDDDSQRRMAVKRDRNRRFTELVRVAP